MILSHPVLVLSLQYECTLSKYRSQAWPCDKADGDVVLQMLFGCQLFKVMSVVIENIYKLLCCPAACMIR